MFDYMTLQNFGTVHPSLTQLHQKLYKTSKESHKSTGPVRPKKKKLCCPHPTKIWKLGRSVDFFFFLRTVRELSFPIFFFKFLNGEKRGRNAVKTHIYKCFFRPLNTNFSKFFAQIWHFQQKNPKKNDPVFSHFTVGQDEGNITFFGGGGLMLRGGFHMPPPPPQAHSS